MDKRTSLLPKDALNGKLLALSVSSSPDTGRLGLLDDHLRLALGEIARMVLLAGGQLGYGGHLEPSGYTPFIVNELYRYSRRDEPVKLFLGWGNHRSMKAEELTRITNEFSLHAELIMLSKIGQPITLHEREQLLKESSKPEESAAWLSSMRRYIASRSHAHFLIGGVRSGYAGDYPGVIEETLCALETGRPIYPAAGFGGATLDVAKVLYDELIDLDIPKIKSDKGHERGLEMIKRAVQSRATTLETGLTDDELKRLLQSYRPSEIASLVGLGLGRLSNQRCGDQKKQ